MKNLLNFKSINGANFFNLLAIALCFYCLTACQKNEMEDVQTHVSTEAQLEDATTTAQKEMTITRTTTDSIETTAIPSLAAYHALAKSRSTIDPDEITCGESLQDDTYYGINDYTMTNLYQKGCYASGSSFNGKEMKYLLEIKEERTVKITLSNLRADLDLFLYTLRSNGRPGYCVTEPSTNSNRRNEEIEVELTPGLYVIIVDAYHSQIESSFTLTVDCETDPTGDPIDCILFEDDFESYRYGAPLANYPNWGSHIRVAGPSGKVSSRIDIKAGKSLNVNNRHGENSSAVALIKGANKDVQYVVSFKLFVESDGNARIFLYNQNYQKMDAVVFSSPTYKNRWISVEFAVSQGGNYSELYINGYKQSNWKHRFGANDQLSYVSFHTKNDGRTYDFWVDDFSVRIAK